METEKILQDRLVKVAQDMAKEAGGFMRADGYGQWAELVYQTKPVAESGGREQEPHDQAADLQYQVVSHTDETATGLASSVAKPLKNKSVDMSRTLVQHDMNHVPHEEKQSARIADVPGSYYFMDALARHADVQLPVRRSSDIGRINGQDILDTHFLSEMANGMFKSAVSGMGMPSSPPMANNIAAYGTLPYFLADMHASQMHGVSGSTFDVEGVRRDFPILQRKVHGKPLIWLDNGATTQKPQVVIDRVSRFYEQENSNVHRGAHALAAESTDAYEDARSKVAAFLGAALPEEIVFVRGTTEGINLLAYVCGDKALSPGDEILLTEAEHHANIVPWQFAAQKTGAVIRVAPVDDNGEIIIEEYARLLGPKTRVVAMTHVSNVLGTVMPIHEMTRMAKRYGATVVIDGAQGVPHRRVDVQSIGCDFYVFSGHKLFGPTGIGVIYGRKELWEKMSPWQGGGNMIQHVTFEKSTFAPAPNKFEAGTGSLASAVGLGAAIDYLNSIGLDEIERYETDLLDYALDGILRVKGLRVIGMPKDRGGVISFVMKGRPDIEVGKALDAEGIAVRAGHHCAQPVLAHFGLESSVRPAFAFYNTKSEADALVDALHRISSS